MLAIVETVDGGILAKGLHNGVVEGDYSVVRVRMNTGCVQDTRHYELLAPLQALTKVLELIVEFIESSCTGAMLQPFMLPEPILRRGAL